jgi:Diphthamide synthase
VPAAALAIRPAGIKRDLAGGPCEIGRIAPTNAMRIGFALAAIARQPFPLCDHRIGRNEFDIAFGAPRRCRFDLVLVECENEKFPPQIRGRPEPRLQSLAREMIASRLSARIACLDPRKIDRSFAGRLFDAELLRDLPDGIDPCGENGEFHTAVTAGPMFARDIAVCIGETVERDGFIFTDVIPAPSC